MRRLRLLPAGLALVAAVGVVAGCSSDGAPVDPTAPLGLSNTIDTLFPPSRETIPIEEGTAPEGALFGGDLCASLTADDVAGVELPTGPATLLEFGLLAVDRCEFLLEAGVSTFRVLVQAVGPGDFAALVDGIDDAGTTPGTDPAVFESIPDLGLEAYGLDTGSDYQVWMQVDRGYVRLVAPDRSSALELADRVAANADR